MPIEAPRLDDRSYNDLVAEARRKIPHLFPGWTDHNASDPGITLIELFAWMTDIVLYRLNRVPDKHFIKLMELIGMRVRESEPARALVTFWLSAPQPRAVSIDAGKQVATERSDTAPAIIFTTDVTAVIEVPQLISVMTSRLGADKRRTFHNILKLLETETASISIFGGDNNTPQVDDALYLGFDNDLSDHILGVQVEVVSARGYGINPKDPPLVWEVLDPDENRDEESREWVRVNVDIDNAGGFNQNGLIRLYLPKMQKLVRGDVRAYWLRCRIVPDDTIYKTSPVVRKLKTASWGITVSTTNVSTVTDEVVGRSDGSPGQRFFLEHTPVVPRKPGEQLRISPDKGKDEIWQEVPDFATSGENERCYTLDSMNGEVRFPPALPQPDGSIKRYGAIPPKNAVIVMRSYRYGGGYQGNVAAGAIRVLKDSIAYVARVVNLEAAFGGVDAESLEDCKLRVPGHLRSLQRAVTAEDYEYLALEAARSEIGRAYCLPDPGTPGLVVLFIIPKVPNQQDFIAWQSLQVTESVQEKIERHLNERRLLATRLEIRQPQYQWVQTEITLRANFNADRAEVQERVRGHLFAFLNPLTGGANGAGWEFGRALVEGDLYSALYGIEGVEAVHKVELYRVEHDPLTNNFTRQREKSPQIMLEADGILLSYDHLITVE
jgi:predicted phage baseplate assembly protein